MTPEAIIKELDRTWGGYTLAQKAIDLITTLTQERDEALAVNERDRTAAIDAYVAISDAINRRTWLLTSRGSYEWDDDRYRDEFRAAIDEIGAPLKILNRIGIDWNHCPTEYDAIQEARRIDAIVYMKQCLRNDDIRYTIDSLGHVTFISRGTPGYATAKVATPEFIKNVKVEIYFE